MWKAIEEAIQHKVNPFDHRGWPWNIFAFESTPFMRDNCARTLNLIKTSRHVTNWTLQNAIMHDPKGVPRISDVKNAMIHMSQTIRDCTSSENVRIATLQIDELYITLEEYLATLPFNMILFIDLLHNDDALTLTNTSNTSLRLRSKPIINVREEDDFFRRCLSTGQEPFKFPLFLSRWPETKPHPDWLPTWQKLKECRRQLFFNIRGKIIRCINGPSSKHYKKYCQSLIRSKSTLNLALQETIGRMVKAYIREEPLNVKMDTHRIQVPFEHTCAWDFIRGIFALSRANINKRIIVIHTEPVWRREDPMSKYYNLMRSFLMSLCKDVLIIRVNNLETINKQFGQFVMHQSEKPNIPFVPKAKDWKNIVRALPSVSTGERTTHITFESSFK